MKWVFALLCFASAAVAAPDQSVRPKARAEAFSAAVAVPVSTLAAFRPVARSIATTEQSAVLRPLLRPEGFEQRAMARKRERMRGAVCDDPDLQGVFVGAVPGRMRGCGVGAAVRLREVSGVALSQEAIMDCATAKALKSWIDKSAKPQLKSFGGGLKRVRVAAHYACRTRNNQPGGRISEHGKGRAIDVSGFDMRDGSTITVLKGWRSARTGRALKAMHKGACGPFGTVLGPNADRFHQDHFHFDTARYRSGSYCR